MNTLQIGSAFNRSVSIPVLQLLNSNGTLLTNPISECKGDQCVCLNVADDSVQVDVVKGDVRLVGILSARESDGR